MKNEKGKVTMDSTNVQRTIWNYYRQLYVNKMDHLEGMDTFLGTAKTKPEETEGMTRPVTSTEIKSVI